MSGGIQTVVRDGRRMSRQPNGNGMLNSTALQGASMAFNARSPNRGAPSSVQSSRDAMRAPTKPGPPRSTQHGDEPDPVSEMPESGLVMDRIKAFSGNTASQSSLRSRAGSDVSGRDTPQMQAAQLAALRSSARTPQTVPSSTSVSPIRRAVTGNTSSRKKAISPAPKPEFLSAQNFRSVHAPTPIRKSPTVARSLANSLDGERASLTGRPGTDLQSRKSQSPVKSTEARHPKVEEAIHSSAERASASPPKTIKSKPERPAAKPKLVQPVSDDRKLQSEPYKKPPSRVGDDDTRAKKSQTSENRNEGTRTRSQSEAVDTISSYTHSVTDDARSSSSHYTTPSRHHTGNANALQGMTKEALADAIVASSLASSRVSSPYTAPPPLPPPRRSRSRSILHPGDILRKDSRTTPSPPKGLRQTLRDPPKSDAEDNKSRGRRHLIRHHPHKHHEGDRKRWRQQVSEAARKRYEGVWAANKGLWVPPEPVIYRIFPDLPRTLVSSDLVVNLVVRDIWSRSRVPLHTLELIWNLVDRTEIGMLSREEFVVGLWLIDEILKGHKLPVKVPDSVWESVRHLPGIKIPQEFG
ncbi:conserved hypothetical protein [Talaromyces stipitatus ATCC 10500]|uniref:EH domain-containing protein n=1 Tax=Talaromyces stipitatus (strain ATCC 10500 / CBS 375.48 / QM 6759 / NRRL 1006) TaxID=441959 RepID=B8LXG2_TALSN|nr:uncharacterized protein TSTA_066860 [Talaromyces stipitatus ATCC 10500]EED23243.1 conserved hypothetical protein [Talaromyces stipitatus ATCC 10500]